ncbi:MAG TPA: glycosyltransferase family 39 protein, partial [Candidatus Acidoferrum sp.]|nr:glycosyltransferase family 39 protein [Candidatus Acidoferrum sp.]
MKSYRALTLFWLLGFFCLILWIIRSSGWPLEAEEAQYWNWSRHLDWSYYSKGPMVAYLIALSTRLGGQTEFWVRLPAVLLGLGLLGTGYTLARRMFRSERAGFLSVVLLSVIPLYTAGCIVMTTDTPFIFFWGLAILSLDRAVRRPSKGSWYGAGAAFGLGLLSKYTMLMLLPCALLWLLVSRRLRPWLRRREPYEALLLGL